MTTTATRPDTQISEVRRSIANMMLREMLRQDRIAAKGDILFGPTKDDWTWYHGYIIGRMSGYDIASPDLHRLVDQSHRIMYSLIRRKDRLNRRRAVTI